MSFDTRQQNKLNPLPKRDQPIWLFGYGSLIHKVDFPFLKARPAQVLGWERRFWQGSHDHRGTPERPGRVLTLIENSHSVCFGMAYQVTHEVFEHLDYREKNGYLRRELVLHMGPQQTLGLVYIAEPTNAAYLGPDTDRAIAAHIYSAVGPSGRNADYLLDLAESLRSHQQYDAHVFALERCLLELMEQDKLQGY